jgi:diguanylate cyclase (GGDEF)-like protein
VNDTHGHLAGDAVLLGLSRRLKPRIRREDILARVGGEEFAVVLADTNREGSLHFAEDLRQIIEREPFNHHEMQHVAVTISLGVAALQPGERIQGQDLVRRADTALYAAKNGGRNRVVG